MKYRDREWHFCVSANSDWLLPPVRVEGEEAASHPGSAPVGSALLSDLPMEVLSRHHPRKDTQTEGGRERDVQNEMYAYKVHVIEC